MRKKLLASIFTFLIAGTIILPKLGFAALDPDADLGLNYGTATELSSRDPRTIAANIINAALGLLGTITIVLIVYGGFLWMTAAGNDDAVSKAKKIMIAGVIGLVIVLSAFAIASYVVEQLNDATA